MITDEEMGSYLLPLAIFHTIITLTGIVGNAIMCIITIKARNLHSTCHILIGFTCFCDALHGSAHIPFLYGLYTNTKWIAQKDCYFLLIAPVFGEMVGLFLLLSLGLDRLFAVLKPMRYRHYRTKRFYLVALFFFPILYFFGFAGSAWFERADVPVMCCPPEFFLHIGSAFALSPILIVVLTLIVYLLVYYKLRTSSISKTAKTVFKSIFVTVLFVFFGWFSTQAIKFTGIFLGATGNELFLFRSYAGVPVNVSCACNIFAYYFISADYKTAIRRHIFRDDRSPNRPAVTEFVIEKLPQTPLKTLSAAYKKKDAARVGTLAV